MLLATETNTLGNDSRSSPRSVISQPSRETMIAAAPCQYWWNATMIEPEQQDEGAG